MRVAGIVRPVEFQEVALAINGKNIVIPTGTGGVFDIDLSQSDEFKKLTEAEESGCASFVAGPSFFIQPGTYQGTVNYLGKARSFPLVIPASTDQIIDLGEIIVEVPLETAPAEVSAPALPKPLATGAALPAVPAVAPNAAAPSPTAKPKAPEQPAVAPPPKNTAAAPQELPEDLPVMEVNFRFGTAQLASGDDFAILNTAQRLLELFPYARLVIQGFTDQMGSQHYNEVLSKKRALAVAAALKKLGIPADKFAKISWFGKRVLLCNSLEEHCREQNRRVVIQLVAGP